MTTVQQLHAAILQAVIDHFGVRLTTVGAYQSAESAVAPALLLEMDSGYEGPDLGDARVPLRCVFSAHCILANSTTDQQLELRALAGEVLGLIRGNRWGLGADVACPENIRIKPGTMTGATFASWMVTWEQTLYMGQSVWSGSSVPVTSIYLSVNGQPHELLEL